MTDTESQKMKIYQDGRRKLKEMDEEKEALVKEFEEAKNSTAGLKVTLSNYQIS